MQHTVQAAVIAATLLDEVSEIFRRQHAHRSASGSGQPRRLVEPRIRMDKNAARLGVDRPGKTREVA